MKWEHVYAPKEEARLGFKILNDWNKATLLRHLWVVCKKADTLWVKWIHTYVIKKLGAGWESSWTLKNIFKLQEIGQTLIKYEVGDGNSTFLWLENWHPFGSSYRSHGKQVVFNLGRSLQAKIADIVHDGA